MLVALTEKKRENNFLIGRTTSQLPLPVDWVLEHESLASPREATGRPSLSRTERIFAKLPR
jgi:hypothetical protein